MKPMIQSDLAGQPASAVLLPKIFNHHKPLEASNLRVVDTP